MSDPQPCCPSTPDSPTAPRFVDVVLPRRLHRLFTYAIPVELLGRVAVGASVIVPFGARDVQALVTALHMRPPSGAPADRLKAVRALATDAAAQDLTPQQLELSRWLAERYAAPWGQCIKLVMPPAGPPLRVESRYAITDQGRAALASPDADAEARLILTRLARRSGGIAATTLTRGAAPHAVKTLQALVRNGWATRHDAEASHRPKSTREPRAANVRASDSLPVSSEPDAVPPSEAASWPEEVRRVLMQEAGGSLVLQTREGVRRWCLVQAVRDTLRCGRRVLIVTGDVARAGRVRDVVTALGEHPIVLHSGLPPHERAAAWTSAAAASASIVIGTRMAVFAPMTGLGLVWVEGEEDPSLKEEQVPRYHARDVAAYRAGCDRALLVLASSHPSLESWAAVQQGTMTACRYRDVAAEPQVTVIDAQSQPDLRASGNLLSPPLVEALRDAVERRTLAIVYLNRKGFASVLHCTDCGAMPQCDVCSVALTFHRQSQRLRCHYCGRAKPVPDQCPPCRSLKLEPVGIGTERLEESIRRLFPHLRVGRADGDTLRRPAETRAFLRLVAAGEMEVVIGTQLLFRLGLPARAGVVVAPDADAGLHVPDFRSAERLYHGLVDAVELAQPAALGGRVLIQTRFPEHHVMQAVATGDSARFVAPEQMFRQLLRYPPATQLIRLDVSGTQEPAVAHAADRWAARLRADAAREPAGQTDILGPSPAPHAMRRGRYSRQILVKTSAPERGRAMVQRTLALCERDPRPGALRMDVDVDPVAME